MTTNTILEHVKSYFNLTPDREDEQVIIKKISQDVSFHGANLWVLIFAIFIASLGLDVNSTAVIIGAMLISPLMGPIIGMGLAVGINDLDLLKRAAKNFAVATLISVITATLYFLLTPLGEARSELLARTSPTLYDVLIAFCGGAAGIIALCTGGKGNVIPGVAIATALMPPLCTAGYGLATGHFLYFLGAFYLFFINTVFIAVATYAGVRLMKFHRQEFLNAELAKRAKRIVMTIVLLTMLPATVMTVSIVHKSIFNNNVRRFVKNELFQSGTQIISIDTDDHILRIVAVGKEITEKKQAEAQEHMKDYSLDKYTLNVIQGTQSDSILMLSNQLNQATVSRESERQKLLELSTEANMLNQMLTEYTRFEELSATIRPELATLFPQISSLAMSRTVETERDSAVVRPYVAAIIKTDSGKRLPAAELKKLTDWLKARTQAADSIAVIQQ
ncbi:MAG: DUF389 domain-containing protein [Prevotella sp.]|nr:DUF389 domain-containing protein [Prevotella sp.]